MARALGRYELLRPLARGGMAEVFLARRRAAGVEKLLVVKRMRPERSGDIRFLDLFVREARLSMSLAHQNIVPVFDFGRIDDQVFLAMERVEGRDLGSSLARARQRDASEGAPASATHGALPPLLAAFVAAECCQALDYAHHRRSPDGVALGIVHRDVTPRNVLLSWSGEVKLTDFGIAALAGEATARVLGTAAYMAPEQARGEALDARADVYAIGLVLCEALTGERARGGDDRDTILAAARAGELTAWATDAIPPALAEIIARATAPDPDARFPDARTMLEAIDAFIVGERAEHRGEAPARRLAAWLAAVWDGERGDPVVAADGDGDGGDDDAGDGHLLSFLDDGELGVVGTGTQHSFAATVDEPAASVSAAAAAAAAAAVSETAAVSATASATVTATVTATATATAAATATVAGGGRRVFGIVVVLGLVLGLGLWIGLAWRSHARVTTAADAAVTKPDAARSIDAAVARDAGVEPDATLPADAAVAHAVKSHVKLAVPADAAMTPVAVVRRNVTINARPWANFTIDDDPAPHQTVETLALTAGPHRIHFSNPALHVIKDVTIDVPADRDLKFVEPLE